MRRPRAGRRARAEIGLSVLASIRVEQPVDLAPDELREALADGVEPERACEWSPVAVVLGTVEREHARPDDLSRREARIVDRERLGVAHHVEREIPPRDEPPVEHRQPGDRLVRAQPVRAARAGRALQLCERRRGADRERRAPSRPRRESRSGGIDSRHGGDGDRAQAARSTASGSRPATGSRCRSPFDGSPVARVAKAGAAEARAAIDAAERAMREPLPAHKRAEILVRVAGALGKRADEAARLISAEAGKPLKAARVEVARAMSTYTMAAVEARKLAGEMVPMDASQAGEGKLAFTLRLPIGVVGAISPFNFPLNLVAHKIAPALAAGCAVVLKPASQTPLSALLLAELEHDAGLPAGWLNVVVGPASEIGDVLVERRARQADHLHRLGGVGWGSASGRRASASTSSSATRRP